MPSTGSVIADSVDLLTAPRIGTTIVTLPRGARVETEIVDTEWPMVLVNPDTAPDLGFVDAAKIRWDAEALPPPPPMAAAGDIVFTGKARAPCSQFDMIKGELAVPNGSGGKVIFNINCGGYGPSFRRFHGPTPPGSYSVSGPFPPDPRGMKVGLVGFKFMLQPGTVNIPGGDTRGSFCIHPDGPPPGTEGCLGVNEREDKLIQCKEMIAALIKADKDVKVIVTYDPGVLF